MKLTSIGCIGCGAMGGAIMSGIRKAFPEVELLGIDHTSEKVVQCGASVADIQIMAARADLIIVAVKPYAALDVIKKLVGHISDTHRPVIVSVASGIGMDALLDSACKKAPVIRCMPNTPAKVGMGAFGMCFDDPLLSSEVREEVVHLFGSLGRVIELPDSKFSAFCALVGCGPAYIFYMIEALSEAGVRLGFSRKQAIDMATYLCAGSARLVMEPNAHPSLLREAVCSPAGATIEGIAVLDERAVKSAFVKAVEAAFKKS